MIYTDAKRIEDLGRLAKRRLPEFVWNHIDSAPQERSNRDILTAIRFAPSILAGATRRSQATTLFGLRYDSPFGVVSMNGCHLLWRDAELALGRAARMANVPFILAAPPATPPAELTRECGAAPWLEVRVSRDHDAMRKALYRAHAAGCEVLVLSTDAERDGVNLGSVLRVWTQVLARPRWLFNVLLPYAVRSTPYEVSAEQGVPNADWRDFIWLRSAWRGKLILKGILRPEDAELAAQLGADGIIVSHEGQSQGSPASMAMLPDIASAVGRRLVVLVQGGFCRGEDIVKALAMGAQMVLIGRAALYGLAVAGEAGAQGALRTLHDETDAALMGAGCASTGELGPQCLAARRSDLRRAPSLAFDVPDVLPAGVLPFRKKRPRRKPPPRDESRPRV